MTDKYRRLVALLVVFVIAAIGSAQEPTAPSDADKGLARQVRALMPQLESDRAAERDAAEKQLLELAGDDATTADRFLALLPTESDEMPLALRERLAKIRNQIEQRVAQSATTGTTITLKADSMSLADVFAAIEKQTGNTLIDNREEQDNQPNAKGLKLTFEYKDQPFWSALDLILDQAKLGIYSYGGEDALSIVGRGPNAAARFGTARYSGPFRIEVTEIQAQRNLRQPDQTSLKLQLEVAWEPRLRPIVVSQPAGSLKAATDQGGALTISQPAAVLDVEVPRGTQAAEIVLPFNLPPRNVTKITSLQGKLLVLVPGRQVKFRFDNITKAAGQTQRRGGVQVTLDDVRKNNEIWEVHMRLTLDDDKGALESHRDWVFQNVAYLVGKDDQPIDSAGLETTRQTPNEVGVAYLYDVADGIEGLSWVYETPASIVEMPVEYELKDIELP
jgi:hypothetical protein